MMMTCHLCEKSAIGLCRQCYKFYCREHGDGFCSECQQIGWAIEKQTVTYSYQGRDTERSSNPILTTSSSSSTPDKETVTEAGESAGKKTEAVQEKPRAAAAWTASATGGRSSYSVGGTDYYKIEAITDPANFVCLLPVVGVCRAHDVLMLLRGIDIYRDGFAVELTMRFGPRAESDTVMPHIHPGQHEFTVSDDVGTQYSLHARGGGGGNHESSQRYTATPALNAEAKTLTITVPRLQFMDHRISRRGGTRPEQTYLVGPWIIT
jgi:hypothetical protein